MFWFEPHSHEAREVWCSAPLPGQQDCISWCLQQRLVLQVSKVSNHTFGLPEPDRRSVVPLLAWSNWKHLLHFFSPFTRLRDAVTLASFMAVSVYTVDFQACSTAPLHNIIQTNKITRKLEYQRWQVGQKGIMETTGIYAIPASHLAKHGGVNKPKPMWPTNHRPHDFSLSAFAR